MTAPHENAAPGGTAPTPAGFRSGFVALLGFPNAGKSTLMNALVGEHLAAVSGLPQTTRDRIHGILTTDHMQAVFVDLPGLVDPTDKLNEALRARVLESLEDADAILHLVDPQAGEPFGGGISDLLSRVVRPVLLVATKLDQLGDRFDTRGWAESQPGYDPAWYQGHLAVSALLRAGLPQLKEWIARLLPPGPMLYDPEDLTDRSVRFLAAEMIREKAFHYLHQELPYSTAVEIEEFRESENGKWYIGAVVHLERDTQKGMFIGRGGEMLKKISRAARQSIEELVGAPVYLDLHVRITRNWRKDDARLKQFGYERPKASKRRR